MELLDSYVSIVKERLLLDDQYRSMNQLWLNRAYGIMLVEQGLLDKEDYKIIDKGLVAAQDAVTKEDLMKAPYGQDIYFVYEQALYKEIGMDTACKLHVGRSRNDILFTMYRMSMRDAVWKVMEEIIDAQKDLETHAAEHLDTIMPYYTYGQPAQPGTWGHYLMTIHEFLESDLRRLRHAYETINQCPMGAGAGIGTSFNLNKYRVAELLGFDGVIENTSSANSATDYYLELISAVAILNTTLGRVGSDLDFFASTECGILDGDKSVCGGSSIMPQKKNYMLGASIRSRSNLFNGYLMNVMSLSGSVSMFPLAETYAFFGDFWKYVDGVLTNLRVLRLALERTKIRKDVALARARDGFTAAAAMAEQLTVEIGEPFVKVHHIVGNMIHVLMDEGRLNVANMTGELMKKASVDAVGFEVERSDEEIAKMLDPLASLNAKITGGTPKPEDTKKLMETGKKARLENETWLKEKKDKVEAAYAKIEAGI